MQDIIISTTSIHLFQAKIQWIYGAVDDFVIKQLPHIVTWGLSLAYTNRMAKRQSVYENHGSQLGHDLRYVASAVSHTFMAFGDLLDLYKRFVELGGYLGRVSGLHIFSVIIRLFHKYISELEEFLITFNKHQEDQSKKQYDSRQLV